MGVFNKKKHSEFFLYIYPNGFPLNNPFLAVWSDVVFLCNISKQSYTISDIILLM